MVRRRSGTVVGAGAAGLLALALLAWFLTDPGHDDGGTPSCGGLRATGWRPDDTMTREFARYGDDDSRTDDWTGGDGTRSVRLPDGRTLWLSADTFLDRVHPGGQRVPHPSWVRNSALVMSPGGRLTRTLTGPPAADGRPSALFPGTTGGNGGELWRWPVQAVVEPRAPGSSERVVRVLLWQRGSGAAPWVFGVPLATEVATLSLPDLRLEGVAPVHRPAADTAPERRVLYGTSAVRHGGWTYAYGADERGVRDGGPSRAYVARVPHGALADGSAWRYWNGSRWVPDAADAAPLDFDGGTGGVPGSGTGGAPGDGGPDGAGDGERAGSATNTYTVVRRGGTWLLLTVDAGGPDGKPSRNVVSFWSCAPHGPWHGPDTVGEPPLPPGAAETGASAYNPQGHAEFGGDGGLLLGYDVNVVSDPGAIHRDVELYRPRFLRLTLGPADGG
ncbi:hypothetical protein [Streptomyces phytohabitans]|uniref:hypothetical protein n=1 Tax=Streptomyces phytohabitans TaxID=1150371 RepID=UPI00345C26D7